MYRMIVHILRIFVPLILIVSNIAIKIENQENFPSSQLFLQNLQPQEKVGLRILQQDPLPRISKKSNKIRKNLPNKHVLTKLGVKKVALSGDDYHAKNDKSESNLLIVKLPPNPNYYINVVPCDENYNKNCLNKSSKNLPFNFHINGKPDKIYHYNLPFIDTTQKRNINNRNRSNDDSKVLFHKRQTKNQVSVYKPSLTNNEPINSYFKGNGKFQNLYVMSKKMRRKFEKANQL